MPTPKKDSHEQAYPKAKLRIINSVDVVNIHLWFQRRQASEELFWVDASDLWSLDVSDWVLNQGWSVLL